MRARERALIKLIVPSTYWHSTEKDAMMWIFKNCEKFTGSPVIATSLMAEDPAVRRAAVDMLREEITEAIWGKRIWSAWEDEIPQLIDAMADKAKQEIKEQAIFCRRSIGQKARYA